MSFLQPLLLWGLAAAAVPILIHLLNRLRFRTVKWAAMLFLIRASRSSTRRSRLRHYLILAFRTLAVLLFALALARPLVGGWLGSALAGAPDTVIVLLDRSPSMETRDPARQMTRREQALAALRDLPADLYRKTRFVLIDSALRQPQEIASLAVLPDLPSAAPSDAAADFPALFQSAADWLMTRAPGRAEIWVATDLQSSNWQPGRRDWASLGARIAALPQDVTVRVLAFAGGAPRNRSLSLRQFSRRRAAAAPAALVSLRLEGSGRGEETLPVALALDGTRTPFDVKWNGTTLQWMRRVDLPADRPEGGWGRLEIPADDNPRDNEVFFAFGSSTNLSALLVADHDETARTLTLAASPAAATGSSVLRRTAAEAGSADASRLALLLWQGTPPEGPAADPVLRFVESGGAAVFWAGAKPDSILPGGLRWRAVETAPEGTPFRAGAWEELDGPLAKTSDGSSLPLARLEFRQRQFAEPDPGVEDWITLASFSDGRPLVLRKRLGRGFAYAVASLPAAEWSDLSTGGFLVPFVQRLLEEGGARLGSAEIARVGDWLPPDGSDGDWVSVSHPDGGASYRESAGVYRRGERLVALNRPDEEDAPERLDAERLAGLLPGVTVRVTENLSIDREGRTQTELWFWLAVAALLFLAGEAMLALGETVRKAAVSAPDMKGAGA